MAGLCQQAPAPAAVLPLSGRGRAVSCAGLLGRHQQLLLPSCLQDIERLASGLPALSLDRLSSGLGSMHMVRLAGAPAAC